MKYLIPLFVLLTVSAVNAHAQTYRDLTWEDGYVVETEQLVVDGIVVQETRSERTAAGLSVTLEDDAGNVVVVEPVITSAETLKDWLEFINAERLAITHF